MMETSKGHSTGLLVHHCDLMATIKQRLISKMNEMKGPKHIKGNDIQFFCQLIMENQVAESNNDNVRFTPKHIDKSIHGL